MTRGRVALLAALQATTGRAMAAELDVSPACVSELASGHVARPGLELAFALWDKFSIEPRDWLREVRHGERVEVQAQDVPQPGRKTG